MGISQSLNIWKSVLCWLGKIYFFGHAAKRFFLKKKKKQFKNSINKSEGVTHLLQCCAEMSRKEWLVHNCVIFKWYPAMSLLHKLQNTQIFHLFYFLFVILLEETLTINEMFRHEWKIDARKQQNLVCALYWMLKVFRRKVLEKKVSYAGFYFNISCYSTG